jgi:hypothetical protein
MRGGFGSEKVVEVDDHVVDIDAGCVPAMRPL